MHYPEFQSDLDHCKSITREFAHNYYAACKLLPKEKRDDTFVLYAWVRIPDNYVDELAQKNRARASLLLKQWGDDWHKAFHQKESNHPVHRAFRNVCERHSIAYSFTQSFLKAMDQDLHKKRYETFEELKDYMYGSASVVGLMMLKILGEELENKKDEAIALGTAMQLTNFIRDVYEDYHERDRVYIPQDTLRSKNASAKLIQEADFTRELRMVIEHESLRCFDLYQKSIPGIEKLLKPNRLAIYTALRIYRHVLVKIKNENYNIFIAKTRLSKAEKLFQATIAWLSTKGLFPVR